METNPSKPPKDVVPPNTPVTFVPMPAVDADSGAITTPEIRDFSKVRKGYTAFQNDDVIFAKITPCMENGKAAIARNLINNFGFGSTEFFVFRSKGAILPDYLYTYIRQESYRKLAESKMTGSVGQKRVPKEFVQNSSIPLPPLAEQYRIGSAIEALFARLDAANERLDRVPDILKTFRQSVLAAACDGRLTEGWREDNSEIDSSNKPPKGWVVTDVSNIGDIVTGKTPPKKDKSLFGGEIPFFKPKDLNKGYYIVSSQDTLTKKGLKYVKILPPLTIMVTCIGATIGKTGLSRTEGTTNQQINSIVIKKDTISPNWIYYIFRSNWMQNEIQKRSSVTTLPILNKSRFSKLPVPLPPTPEQHEIVRRVDALFALADSIEAKVAAARERTEKLRQSVLAKAFSGELVETEAELARREARDYEPADVLLERIRVERGKSGKKGKAAK